jgi:glycosyltransferase involved in cell wall biosynthesis
MRTDAMDITASDADRSTPDLPPTFSVIIPTFRRPALVAEAVASVCAQTRTDWECLVVDDGGGDDLELDDPRVRVIRRSTSRGPAAARNAGVAEARGRYLVFLDDDDRFTPARLDLAATGLARADIALCWTRWFRIGDPVGTDAPADARGRRLEGDVSGQILDATTPHLGVTAVRADHMAAFDESYSSAEDVEWWLRVASQARVTTIARVGCELRRHSGERANGTDVASRLAQGERLLDEHADYFRAHPRARAFRWARMAVQASSIGQPATARRWYVRSLRARPTPLAWRGLVRSFGRAATSRQVTSMAASDPSR